MILDGHLVAKKLDDYVLENIEKYGLKDSSRYIAFLLLNNDEASKVYVNMKQKKANKFGIKTKLVEQPNIKSVNKVIELINIFNNDEDCIGILIQLPLNTHLKFYQGEILGNINPKKDIDGLGGVLFGLTQIEKIYFLPATVRAVIEILKFYKISVSGKNVTIIGQSNLIGKPLMSECARQQATIFSFNEFSKKEDMQYACKISDIIISATGSLHLINQSFLSEKKMQVLIDVGWGTLDGKPTGDFDFENINTENYMYTPVPGGVGPVTISSIFANLIDLQKIL